MLHYKEVLRREPQKKSNQVEKAWKRVEKIIKKCGQYIKLNTNIKSGYNQSDGPFTNQFKAHNLSFDPFLITISKPLLQISHIGKYPLRSGKPFMAVLPFGHLAFARLNGFEGYKRFVELDDSFQKADIKYIQSKCKSHNQIMLSNFKLPSKHSSSSSGSLKILNLNEVDTLIDQNQKRKDLFDMLLDDEPIPSHPQGGSSQLLQIHTEQVLKTIEHMNLSPRQANQQGCKCTKIDCLKLYCECFAKGKACNSNCICVCCKNHTENIEEIYHAKQLVNLRHPNYFQGIPAIVPTRRCTCKRSQCRKKYCQCFNAGLKCTEECQCCDCHNEKPNYNEQFYKGARMEIQVQA